MKRRLKLLTHNNRSKRKPTKRPVLAATASLFISTATASALELNCGAPRVALGDDLRDINPVIGVTVRYLPDDHQWRVFHQLRNGLVISRSEQYTISDASDARRIQWQGSLNRARNLYMIGEVRRDEGGLGYMEWLYDRNKNNALVMQASARCSGAATTRSLPADAHSVAADVTTTG